MQYKYSYSFEFIKQWRQMLLSNLCFARFSKADFLKWKIWNCHVLQKFVARPMIFFSNFSDQNWIFHTKNKLHFLQKYRLFLEKAVFSRIITQFYLTRNLCPEWMYMTNFYWLIIKLFLVIWLLGLLQVTRLCQFLLSLDHGLEITHRLPNIFLPPVFLVVAIP